MEVYLSVCAHCGLTEDGVVKFSVIGEYRLAVEDKMTDHLHKKHGYLFVVVAAETVTVKDVWIAS